MGFVAEYAFTFLKGSPILYGKGLYFIFNVKLPFNPIYGFGVLLLIFLQKIYGKMKFLYKGILNGVVIISLELISGLFFLLVMNHRIWDYSSHSFNLLGIISLPQSIWWISIGYIFAIIYPILEKKLK
jgi:uncharacterized membrane protein